jgi:3-oxoacyl-[acyl-carrier protein] reductase
MSESNVIRTGQYYVTSFRPMDLKLNDKRALVTAGSYGLGYACARSLSMEGAQVTICSRDQENIKRAIDSLSEESGNVISGFSADLTKSNELEGIVDQAKATMGGIDILVVCTGHPPTHPFSQATDEDWNDGLDLVLQPVIKLTRAVLPDMKQQQFGRLIYLGSVFGLEPEVSSIIQSTLRTGLNAFSKCIATENAIDGVTSNVICPGYFDTPLCQNLSKQYAKSLNTSQEEVLESWKNIAPVKKFGDPSDLGDLVAFISSDKGKFITGTSISIDGGFLKGY